MFSYISECNLPMLGYVLMFKYLGVQAKLRIWILLGQLKSHGCFCKSVCWSSGQSLEQRAIASTSSIPHDPVSVIKAFFFASCSKQLWNIAEFIFIIFFYILFSLSEMTLAIYIHYLQLGTVHVFKIIQLIVNE